MRTYIRVDWQHQHPDEPVQILSELDEERMEQRKIHIFRNGRVERAASDTGTEVTWLSYLPVPNLLEINSDPQFSGCSITREEFETFWISR